MKRREGIAQEDLRGEEHRSTVAVVGQLVDSIDSIDHPKEKMPFLYLIFFIY